MTYHFEVMYPFLGENLVQLQINIIRQYPSSQIFVNINKRPHHITEYTVDNPNIIAHIATALKNLNRGLFIIYINHNGRPIYYSSAEVRNMSPIEKQQYIKAMEGLSADDRLLHDYLINLYQQIPT